MSKPKEVVIMSKSNFDDISYATGFGMEYSRAKTKMAIFSNGLIGLGGSVVAGISSYLLEMHKDLPSKEKVALTVVGVLGGAAAAGGISAAFSNAKALKEIEKVNDKLEKAISKLDDDSTMIDEVVKAISQGNYTKAEV